MRSRALLVPMAAAAAVGAAAVARRRRPDPVDVRPLSATSRARRNAELARAGARAGGTLAVHRARRTFASAERRRELDARFELKTAEQVAATLGNMKGALMKIGQMASFLDQGLPEPVRQALGQLLQDAPPMSPELSAGVVTTELGAPPGELFAEWDPVPIAAASIGQVHRAMTRDGRAVAVKVQYPGVDDAIRADLDNAGMLAFALGSMFPGLETESLVEEIRERLTEELDYRLEAENQRLFGRFYDGHPFIHIPAVVDELSTRRVLTTELADGVRFEEMEAWGQEERNLAAETIYRFVFRSLYRLHAFNGDPHPGNYLFRKGGQVTFLDFGLVKRFSPDEIDIFEDMMTAFVLDHDIAEFRRVIERVGFLSHGQPFTDEQVADYFGHFYEFVYEPGEITIEPDYASESVRRYFDTGGPYGEIIRAANVPKFGVIIQRISLGLYAILARLHACADWRTIAEELWPWVDGPPSTPMGEAEREWWDNAHLGAEPRQS